MAFNESDNIEIIKKIEDILEDRKNSPLSALFLIKRLMGYYKKYPVYPSLAVKIFEQASEKTEFSALEKGDIILVETDKEKYLGAVKDLGTDGKTVKLSDLSKETVYRSKAFDRELFKKIVCLTDKPVKAETSAASVSTTAQGGVTNA